MRYLLFIILISMVTVQVNAQSQNQEKKKEETKATKTWVVRGAQVFNSKGQVKAQQAQPKVIQSAVVQPQSPRPSTQVMTTNQAPVMNTMTARSPYATNTMQMSQMKAMAVQEKAEYMSQGTRTALVVNIEGADSKTAKKIWKGFVKSQYKTTVKKVKKEQDQIADDVKLGLPGHGGTVDIYSRAEDRGNNAKMMVWIDLGGQYINSTEYPSWYNYAQDMMYEYELEVKRALVKQELKSEEKKLKKLQANLKKLRKANERYHRIIKKSEKQIENARSEIETNIVEQSSAQEMIEAQIRALEMVNEKLNSIR